MSTDNEENNLLGDDKTYVSPTPHGSMKPVRHITWMLWTQMAATEIFPKDCQYSQRIAYHYNFNAYTFQNMDIL